jgi:hypothetical protein
MKYGINSIMKGIRNPGFAAKVISRDINRWWSTKRGYSYNPEAVSIQDKDWDNLIIIDACRYDYFAQLVDKFIDGDLQSVQSLGSSSSEFIRANFAGQQHNDLVVTSANSWYEYVYNDAGYTVHDLAVVKPNNNPDSEIYEKFERTGRTGWVLPEPTTEKAIEMVERYPNKRHLIHYHQPHTPFIGPTGQEYFDELPHKLGWIDGNLSVSDDIIRQAYKENVEIALRNVMELLNHLEGKTVISGDHGEMLGERGVLIPWKHYGHISGYYTDELTKVPWFVIKSGNRRTITAESPGKSEIKTSDMEEINDRLKKLGYKV